VGACSGIAKRLAKAVCLFGLINQGADAGLDGDGVSVLRVMLPRLRDSVEGGNVVALLDQLIH